MPETVKETANDQQQQQTTTKTQSQKSESTKSKMGGSPKLSRPLPDSHQPHKSQHQPVVLGNKKPPHKAKQKPVSFNKPDSNSQVFDVLAINESIGYEALKSLLYKYSDQIGQELVSLLLTRAGTAIDYLTAGAALKSQAGWINQKDAYLQQFGGFRNSIKDIGAAVDKYGTAIKTAQDTYQTVNSPGLHVVRVFLKYLIGRGTAYVMSLGKEASPKTIHNVTTMSENLSYLSDLKARYRELKLAAKNYSGFLHRTIELIEQAASTSQETLVKIQSFSLSQLMAWGWENFGTGQSFSEFVLTNNSNIGKIGSASIVLSALGIITAAATGNYKLAMGSFALGGMGLAAKGYDHKYMGKKDEQDPDQINLPQVEQSQGPKPQDTPDQNRFFWMNLHHGDIMSWDSGVSMPNEQWGITKMILGKQESPNYKSGGAEVKFGMGFNIFGRKILASNDHTMRLDWGGNFEYSNSDIMITDQLMKFNDAFEIGAVHLTNIRMTNKGLQSMGLELKKVNVAGETFQVDSLKAEWSKSKGIHFETKAKANLLDHQFNGKLSFDLDNDGKLINGDISIGSGDTFEILKDVLTISNFLLSGSINEKNQVSIGAESDLELMKDNPHFSANVSKAYVKYDQTREKPWMAGVNVFEANIMGKRVNILFNDAHIADNKLNIAKATLSYTKGGDSNGDDGALKSGGIFGDLENIFSVIETLQVSASVGKVSLSKAGGFKFGEKPKWALNKFTAKYAGFTLDITITDEEFEGSLKGDFSKNYNIFNVLVETPIPAVPGVNLVGKASLDANLGANADLKVSMDKKDERNKNKNGDKYFKISGKAGLDAGVGLTAGLGASIGIANVASISGMLLGRFAVNMNSSAEIGATLVFNRQADQKLRQGELPSDKFRMRAEASVTPTFEISGGLFFNLLQQEFSLAQYSLARWELGKGKFAFEAAPDEKTGKYRITPDEDNTTLNGQQFLKDKKQGFSKAVKKIPAEREKYVKMRETFDQAEEALGKDSKDFDKLVEQLTEQGKGAESQMLDTLSIMVAKHEALVNIGGKQELAEANSLKKEIKQLKRDTKKVLMVNHNPKAAVEYLHYYRTKKSFKANFNKMLRKHFAIWDWRLLNRYAKNSLEADGVKRVHNPGLFGSSKDKNAHSEYNKKLRKREQEISQEFDVDKRLDQRAKQNEQEAQNTEPSQIDVKLVQEVQSHIKDIENDMPRQKRNPGGD